jgi:hypothetical protein
VNPLQNKVNSTSDHCFARGMYEFKCIVTYEKFKIIIDIVKKDRK